MGPSMEAPPLEPSWRVSARLLSGEPLAEQLVQPGSSVSQLSRSIAAAAGMRGCLRLVHDGVALAGGLTVAEAGLHDGAAVIVVRSAGLQVATNSTENVSIWSFDNRARRPLATLDPGCAVRSLALSPDGARVALGCVEPYPGDNIAAVSLWKVETGQRECVWEVQNTSHIFCIAFAPDGRSLAGGIGDACTCGSVVIWSLDTLQQRVQFESCSLAPLTVAYSPCGRQLVTGEYLAAQVWDVDTCRCIGTFREHTSVVLRACFSPDGALVATASEDCMAMLWSPADCRLHATLSGHEDMVAGLGFSPDGALLVTASSDSTAKIWEVSSGRCLRTLDWPDEDVRFAAFSPDGTLVITGSEHLVRLWSAETGEGQAEFENEEPMAISPDL